MSFKNKRTPIKIEVFLFALYKYFLRKNLFAFPAVTMFCQSGRRGFLSGLSNRSPTSARAWPFSCVCMGLSPRAKLTECFDTE